MPNRTRRSQLGVKLTEQVAGNIKWLLEETNLNYMQIAATVGLVNIGRISEIKNGHPFRHVKPKKPS